MSSRQHRVRGLVGLAALLLGASMLSACDNGPDLPGIGDSAETPRVPTPAPTTPMTPRTPRTARPAGSVSTNVKSKTDVPVDTVLAVSAP